MFYPPNAEVIKNVMRSKGHAVFGSPKGYDLNLFGIRTTDTRANEFNDWVGVMYLEGGVWNKFVFPATTDPGAYWREHPMNADGTAALKPGQYRSSHKVGEHKGYPALQQKGPVVVYRDPDRNLELNLDDSNVQEGMFGINIHRASIRAPSNVVNKWSAGCQVLQDPIQFGFLLELACKSALLHGNSFTYTLLTEADFS